MTNINLKYSAGIVSKLFWDNEMKKTAHLLVQGYDKESAKKEIVDNNDYQSPSRERTIRTFGAVYSRCEALPSEFLTILANGSTDQVRIIDMIGIMLTDRFIFEFMYEVYRRKILLGDLVLRDKDYNNFYLEKRVQSEDVAKWTESTQDKVRQTIFKILLNAGLIQSDKKRQYQITRPLIEYEIEQYLRNNNMKEYLFAMTGEQ